MGLIISLTEGETFNIGHRRYVVADVGKGAGCSLTELGGGTFSISPDKPLTVAEAVIREGLRSAGNTTRLDISCAREISVWRGQYAASADVALLAPVPLEHLETALDVQQAMGRVAFGSNAWELFPKIESLTERKPCSCYIYASGGQVASSIRATWVATYLRHVESRMGAHPEGAAFRPQSTLKYRNDNIGHWAVFWEVTDLRRLDRADEIPIDSFQGVGKKSRYLKSFRPEGPLIVEPL